MQRPNPSPRRASPAGATRIRPRHAGRRVERTAVACRGAPAAAAATARGPAAIQPAGAAAMPYTVYKTCTAGGACCCAGGHEPSAGAGAGAACRCMALAAALAPCSLRIQTPGKTFAPWCLLVKPLPPGAHVALYNALLRPCHHQDKPHPRGYVALRAGRPPVIDGVLDEDDWGGAPWSEPFIDIVGPSGACVLCVCCVRACAHGGWVEPQLRLAGWLQFMRPANDHKLVAWQPSSKATHDLHSAQSP